MRVPALRLDSGDMLTQSLAIIEYLDEIHPQPPLLPRDPVATRQGAGDRADHRLRHPSAQQRRRRCATSRTCSARTRARSTPGITTGCIAGFDAHRRRCLRPAPYAFGSEVTLADICLVPQVYNARRLKVPLDRYPKIVAVDAACAKLAAFDKARPENQPDAE